ncbi:MAG TPA: hypothetical protein VFB63_12230 [Bryobacteraceae bacterium]|nr:hypothetical protein [Bryobacteraceae bacterium]
MNHRIENQLLSALRRNSFDFTTIAKRRHKYLTLTDLQVSLGRLMCPQEVVWEIKPLLHLCRHAWRSHATIVA